jgi:hypothetical protein
MSDNGAREAARSQLLRLLAQQLVRQATSVAAMPAGDSTAGAAAPPMVANKRPAHVDGHGSACDAQPSGCCVPAEAGAVAAAAQLEVRAELPRATELGTAMPLPHGGTHAARLLTRRHDAPRRAAAGGRIDPDHDRRTEDADD